jgi:pyrroloquinoline-quinone synthase
MESMESIELAIAERHLLKHPFYEAWTAGTLPREALRDYARQYYAFESRLPRFLTSLHARSESVTTRAALLSNAWDEEHGENNHAELWLRFAGALDVERAEVQRAPQHEATTALVDTYWQAATDAPVEAGVAALYAYESQLPAVAEAKIAGLERHYGICSADGLAFFEVHRAVDPHHATEERRILEKAITGPSGDVTLAWTKRALEAWWSFLSGVLSATARE